MYCLSILDGEDTRQLFYYSHKLALRKQKDLVLDELNSWSHKDNEISDDVSLANLEKMLKTLITRNYRESDHADSYDDNDDYYDKNKFEVYLNKIEFQDDNFV